MNVLARITDTQMEGSACRWSCRAINPDFSNDYVKTNARVGYGADKEEALMSFRMNVAEVEKLNDFEDVKVKLV